MTQRNSHRCRYLFVCTVQVGVVGIGTVPGIQVTEVVYPYFQLHPHWFFHTASNERNLGRHLNKLSGTCKIVNYNVFTFNYL